MSKYQAHYIQSDRKKYVHEQHSNNTVYRVIKNSNPKNLATRDTGYKNFQTAVQINNPSSISTVKSLKSTFDSNQSGMLRSKTATTSFFSRSKHSMK